MNLDLTVEQIAFYKLNGFVAHRHLLSVCEVAELKKEVLATVDEMYRTHGKKRVAGGDTDIEDGHSNYHDRVFTQRLNLWRMNSAVKRVALDPELGRLLSRLEDARGFRLWHDQAVIKEPYGNPTIWHADIPSWSFSSRNAISIWIALEDATYENGCLWFIPGSHIPGIFKHPDFNDRDGGGLSMDALFRAYPTLTEADPVGVPMKAGDCSFHNGLTAHAAGANMTRGRRIAVTCAYMPIESRFNGQRNVLPKAYFESLKKGDRLANDDWNPVVFQA